MISTLFIFFAGIALILGLIEVWLAMARKKFGTDFIFGVFTLIAGCYYLMMGLNLPPKELEIFFAAVMFALFPWYYALELGYVQRKFLWSISGLCMAFFLVILFKPANYDPNIQYIFSYSVYILTTLYCFIGLANIRPGGSFMFYPFLVVSLYYTIFVMEEMAFNYWGMQLPWRRGLNFNYLDLFPMIIIVNKLVLIIRDQWNKGALEHSLKYYRDNLNLILEKADKLVLALDAKGNIIHSNQALQKLFGLDNSVVNLHFKDLLQDTEGQQFRAEVLENENQKGSLVSGHLTKYGKKTVAWSFIKQDFQGNEQAPVQIYLFGSDITRIKKTEENLREAYEKLEILKNKIQAENIQLRTNLHVGQNDGKIIGKSALFHYVMNRVEDAAPLDIPVLLEGETGVGKEIFANAIHEKSARRHKSFIKINCAAIPGELLESELFGYEKGAFTGAEKNKKGVFELADGGTLFLDEIGELPVSLQPKILRAIQEQRIQPLGAERDREINIRLLLASNRNLLAEVEKGNFRSDLYYRINVFPITIPPLRKRKADIPLLVEWFVDHFNQKYSKDVHEVSESLLELLQEYTWPGNVRQLRNVIERAIITSSETVLKLAAPLPQPSFSQQESLNLDNKNGQDQEIMTLEEFERLHITQTLQRCNWKISGKSSAAEALDLPPSTLRSKMKKLDIKHDPR